MACNQATMSSSVRIESAEQFNQLLKSSKIVIADCMCPLAYRRDDSHIANSLSFSQVYADWCQPCKAIAPLYEKLASQMSKPNVVTFTKVNTEKQQQIAAAYAISSIPTFIMFRDGKVAEKVTGADPIGLQTLVQKISQESQSAATGGGSSGAAAGSSSNSALGWRGAALPRGYTDVTDQIEVPRTELLNFDEECGTVRVLFDSSKPSVLLDPETTEKDWVLSDTDEQLLLFTPFMSMVKLHTLQVLLARFVEDYSLRLLIIFPCRLLLLPTRTRISTVPRSSSCSPIGLTT